MGVRKSSKKGQIEPRAWFDDAIFRSIIESRTGERLAAFGIFENNTKPHPRGNGMRLRFSIPESVLFRCG